MRLIGILHVPPGALITAVVSQCLEDSLGNGDIGEDRSLLNTTNGRVWKSSKGEVYER